MKEITIETILDTMRNHILNDDRITKERWIDSAMRLNVLSEGIDNRIAGCEACMAEEKAKLIENGDSAAKAKALCVRAIDYEDYLKLKAQRKRIDEYIMLAKKQASNQFV